MPRTNPIARMASPLLNGYGPRFNAFGGYLRTGEEARLGTTRATVRRAGCAPIPQPRAEDAHLGGRRDKRGAEGSIAAPSLLSSNRDRFPTARTSAAQWPHPSPFAQIA